MKPLTIKLPNIGNTFVDIENCYLGIGEIAVEIFPKNTRLYDIISGYDISKIKALPIKRIKIGNGSQHLSELKAIVILDNGDFIITKSNGEIIDYITNSSPLSVNTLIID